MKYQDLLNIYLSIGILVSMMLPIEHETLSIFLELHGNKSNVAPVNQFVWYGNNRDNGMDTLRKQIKCSTSNQFVWHVWVTTIEKMTCPVDLDCYLLHV